MADVPKSMAASASAISLPARARKREEEAELVRLAQSGEEAAFEELIRRHQQRVFGLVHGILRRGQRHRRRRPARGRALAEVGQAKTSHRLA